VVPKPAQPKVSRRALLLGGGVTALAAAGGATAWALTRKPGHPTPGPSASTAAKAVTAPKPVWTYPATDSLLAQHPALVLNGSLFLPGRGITALDASSGTVRWARPELIASHVLAADGQLLLLGADVSSVDPESGRQLPGGSVHAWGSDRKVIRPSTILAAGGGIVYLKVLVTPEFEFTGDQYVLALKDGMINQLWHQAETDPADSIATAALAGSTLLHSTGKSAFTARATADGRKLWQVETGTMDPWPVWCDDQRLYCLADDADLQAVALADGRQAWRLKSTNGRFTPVATGPGVVFTSDGREAVSAFDAATGKEVWTCPLPKRPSLTSPPVLVGGTLFVPGDYGMGLHAVDARSGKLRWTFQDETNPGSTNDWYVSTDGRLAFARLGTWTYAFTGG
jgi:outer membrane protein assembly factor BamB